MAAHCRARLQEFFNMSASPVSFAQAANHLLSLSGKRVLVLTHAKPDGDALGSLVAMVEGLRLMGALPQGVLVPLVPAPIAGFAANSPVSVLDQPLGGSILPSVSAAELAGFEAAVVLDTQAFAQVAAGRSLLDPLLPQTIVIDHHLTGDLVAPLMCVQTSAAATGEMVFDVLTLCGIPVGQPGAQSPALSALRDGLFLAIASDTGWFRFSNTTPKTHRVAAALQECGVDAPALYERTMQNERPARLAITARALGSVRFLANDRAALMSLNEKDFAETGARNDEYEGVVDFPRQVSSVLVVCLATEVRVKTAGGGQEVQTRMSFRSKPDVGKGAVDCTKVAGLFGGGGHARASGAKVNAPLAEVLPKVEAALVAAIG